MKLISQQQIEELIVAHYPEQTDYWLYGGKGKHTEITVTVKCSKCGSEETLEINNKTELKRLLKRECSGCMAKDAAANAHLNIWLPFGKFKGISINAIMDEEPTYLAWFVDHVKGQDALIEQIKTHTRFPEVWAEYVEMQAKRMPKELREEKEWQEGRFSQQTIDDLFNCFFGEQQSNR